MISIKNTVIKKKVYKKWGIKTPMSRKVSSKSEVSKHPYQEKYGHFDRIDSQLMTILGLFTDCTTLPQPE